uniref:Uncharacterized protein n=1 Tax=Anguilla anguilla TaxID=7936 RepID=A0A0E9TTM8_ANGAN
MAEHHHLFIVGHSSRTKTMRKGETVRFHRVSRTIMKVPHVRVIKYAVLFVIVRKLYIT